MAFKLIEEKVSSPRLVPLVSKRKLVPIGEDVFPLDVNFDRWYQNIAGRYGLNLDPDDPRHYYDYRKAFQEGVRGPDVTGHWPSKYKLEGHPNLVIGGVDTRTGKGASLDIITSPLQTGSAEQRKLAEPGRLETVPRFERMEGRISSIEDFFIKEPARSAPIVRDYLSDLIAGPAMTEDEIIRRARETGKVSYGDIITRGTVNTITELLPLTPLEIGTVATFGAAAKGAGAGAQALAKRFPKLRFLTADIFQAFRDFVTTKKIKQPFSNEAIRDFYTFGREKLSDEAFNLLQKAPKEELVSALKKGSGIEVEVRVPRFGRKLEEIRVGPGEPAPPPPVVETAKVIARRLKPIGEAPAPVPAALAEKPPEGIQPPPKPILRSAESIPSLRPQPVEQVSVKPIRPPTQNWESDPGSMPGEPVLYYRPPDGDFSKSKFAMFEIVDKSTNDVLYEVRNLKGESFGIWPTIEEAANGLEARLAVGKEPPPKPILRPVEAEPVVPASKVQFTHQEKRITPTEARILPSPIFGQTPKMLKDITFNISKGLKVPVITGKPGKGLQRALGVYFPGSASTVIKYQGDLDTTAHELAHSLDDRYGIVSDIAKGGEFGQAALDSELGKFWPHGSATESGPRSTLAYKRAEGVAEFLRAYIVNPQAAKESAPLVNEFIDKRLPDSVKKQLQNFSNEIRAFVGASAHDQVMANVQWEPPKEGMMTWLTGAQSPREFRLTWADKANMMIVDDLKAFTKAVDFAKGEKGITRELLPEKDPVALARLSVGVHAKMDDIFKYGMIDSRNNRITPGGINWLLEPLDKTSFKALENDMKETASYMLAQRTMEKINRPIYRATALARANADAAIQLVIKSSDLKREEILGKNLSEEEQAKAFKEIEKDTATRIKQINKKFEEREFRIMLVGRQRRVSGIGAGISSDYYTADRRLQELNSNPGKAKRIQAAAERYRGWANSTLLYMLGKGRLSLEQYKLIKDNNEYYVAMQRLMEIAPNEEIVVMAPTRPGRRLGAVSEPIKKFKGSTRVIENPYASLMDNTYKAVREADRNEVMKVFRDMLVQNRWMGEGKVLRLGDVGRLASQGDKNTIPIYVEGKKEVWQFQEDVFKALKNLEGANLKVPYAFTLPAKILRQTIINFPAFAVRNWFRDITHRLVVSDVDSKLKDSFRLYGKMDESNLALYGGDQAGHYYTSKVDYIRSMKTAMEEMAKDKNTILLDPRGMLEKWNNYMGWTEKHGRMAEYTAAYRYAKEVKQLDNYNAHLFAASKARGVMDFAVAGTITRFINQMVPFTSAGVRGVARTAEAAEKNPGGFLARWGLFAVVPSIMEYAWNHLSGDIEEYRQLPAYQRDMFYNFKFGPNVWIRIPKSFEIGILSTGVTRTLDRALGNEKAFDGYLGSLLRGIFPFDEAALGGPFGGVMQVMANYDFFKQKHIVPTHEEKLDLDLRNSEHASRLAKVLRHFMGVDPRKIDFLMRDMFGYAGSTAQVISDIGRKEKKGGFIRQIGLVAPSPAYAALDVQWVFDVAGRRGMENRPEFKIMKGLMKMYFDADTNEKKDKAAEKLRDFAGAVRKSWEKAMPQIMGKTRP